MIPLSEARAIVRKHTIRLPAQNISLAESTGRVLAEDIVADSDLPPFDRAMMDGYALLSRDTAQVPVRLEIAGEAVAGKRWPGELRWGQAVRIMTGAPVPAGADSVQQVELTREIDPNRIEILKATSTGQFIARRASEINCGAVVLRAGETITPAMIATIASFGYSQVTVGAAPRVTIFSTGSELVPVEERPGPDQIRDSNSYSLSAYARRECATVKGLPFSADDPGTLRAVIARSKEDSDLIVITGGVSMGAYDFTKPVLRELGAEILFEKVALRPGKPTVFALLEGVLIFGLPGNPVSAAVTFNLFVRTALRIMQGGSEVDLALEAAFLESSVRGAAERDSYLPASISTGHDARVNVKPLPWAGSSDFVGFARARALIEVPAATGTLEAGSLVRILRLPE